MSTKAGRTTVCFSVLVLLLLTSMQAGALPPAKGRAAADLAHRAYWISELRGSEGAVPLYERILTDYKDYVDIHSVKASLQQMYLRRGRYDDVIALADSVIAEYPNSSVAAWSEFFKGKAYLAKGDRERASEQFQKVFKSAEPRYLWSITCACYMQGGIFYQIGREKLRSPTQPTPPAPKSTPEREASAKAIYDGASAIVRSQGPPERDQQALQDLQNLVTNYSDTAYVPHAMTVMVHAHLNLRQNEEAIAAAREVITNFPGTVQAAWSQLFIGQAYRNMGRLLDAYNAFRDVEAYDSLPDIGPVRTARLKAKEMWGELCKQYPEFKTAGWPVKGRDLTISDLALLNGYDRSDSEACAWVGTCWMASIAPELTLSLYDELAAAYPDQQLCLGIAAVIAGERYLQWVDGLSNPEKWEMQRASAVRLLESVRAIVPDAPYVQTYADLILVRDYSAKKMWPDVIAAGEHSLRVHPGAPFEDELAGRLANAYIQTGRHQDALNALALVMGKSNFSGWIWPAMESTACMFDKQGDAGKAARRMLEISAVSNSSGWRILGAREAARYSLKAGDKAGAIRALEIAAEEIRQNIADNMPNLASNWQAYITELLSTIESEISKLRSE